MFNHPVPRASWFISDPGELVKDLYSRIFEEDEETGQCSLLVGNKDQSVSREGRCHQYQNQNHFRLKKKIHFFIFLSPMMITLTWWQLLSLTMMCSRQFWTRWVMTMMTMTMRRWVMTMTINIHHHDSETHALRCCCWLWVLENWELEKLCSKSIIIIINVTIIVTTIV